MMCQWHSCAHRLRCPQHCAHDPVVRAATAFLPGQRGAHRALVGVRVRLQQCPGRHQHAAGTVTALRRLLGDEGLLQR
ncbi:conserved hypothetical protein, partial [Ricinus communis]